MRTLLHDIRHGVRLLAKNPGFTAVAVITLALGVGANSAIFSVVDGVLLKPLIFRNPDRLMVLTESSRTLPHVSVAYPNFFDWRSQNHVFEDMASFQPRDFNLARADEPENIGGSAVSSNLFKTLGVNPLLGRDFRPDEDRAGTEPVVILDHALWQRRFGGDPEVVGSTLTLDGSRYVIVGVMPPQFAMYDGSQVYTPIGVWIDGARMDRGAHSDTSVVARLRPGGTAAQAQAEMNDIARRLEQQYPITNTGYRVAMAPIHARFVGDAETPILILFAAVGFVLLIACANVANLLLARGSAREREIAIRSALGASRHRVVRQLLTEGFVLAVVSGALGLLFGAWGLSGLLALLPEELRRGIPMSLNTRVFEFTALLSLATVAIFGLVPALEVSKPDLNETLKEGGRTGSGGRERGRLRDLLVVSEIAIALVLLIGAGLMIKSFSRLLAVDPGFNPDHVLTLQVNLRGSRYDKPAEVVAFCQQALERIRTLPGVTVAALGDSLPLTDSHSRSDITIEGQPVPAIGQFPHPDFHRVSTDYFRAMGIPLMRGRSFTEGDNSRAPGVVLVSESLARRFWSNGEAAGRRIMLGRPAPEKPWFIVAGRGW